MTSPFPAVGRRYLVDFGSFRVELHFTSPTSLTYTVTGDDGKPGQSETVTIQVKEIRPNLFLVTWQEADKTTVVHVEDYESRTIITNITSPDTKFEQFHGTFREITQPLFVDVGTQHSPSFAGDIRALFRDRDITCMKTYFYMLDDYQFMSDPASDGTFADHAHARHVLAHLKGDELPRMPQGGPYWSQEQLDLFRRWIDGGFQP